MSDSSESGERFTVVCMRVEDSKPECVAAGSITGFCEACSAPVHLAPSTQAQLVPMQLRVSCVRCVLREAEAEGAELGFGGFLPGQLDELRRHSEDVE